MKCKNWPIGVCSWSLRTDVNGVADAMNRIGIDTVHLGVRAALGGGGNDFLSAVQKQRWNISATMIDLPQEDYTTLDSIKATGGVGPDEYWEQNQELFLGAADVTVKLGVKYLSMHAGFIDESDISYSEIFYERIISLADAAGEKDIMLLLETGQETAEELRSFLEELDHPDIGVNFDPANMILYDKGNPIEAVRILAPWVKHIHVKDANRTTKPGTWGAEVPWGNGQVQTEAFLKTLEEIGFDGTLAVEREAGDDRFGDVKLAAERLRSYGQ
ncbi:MAG: xylose isomerase [Planctomycetes bacterium RBG_13_50_24]|nr:MAG: xylose isomerase [Planctomycetes bacterium RBG_13_50_24]